MSKNLCFLLLGLSDCGSFDFSFDSSLGTISPAFPNRRFMCGKVAVRLPISSSSSSSSGCIRDIISPFRLSRSSSVMPMRSTISSTCLMPRSFAHFRQSPSFVLLPFSTLVIKITATFFLHLLHSVGFIEFLLVEWSVREYREPLRRRTHTMRCRPSGPKRQDSLRFPFGFSASGSGHRSEAPAHSGYKHIRRRR